MKLNKAMPNLAAFPSQAQQAELKRLLAGKWPPLTPLPLFKYGTDEYRAEIYFDRTHGEWVCRKTFLPSNEVLERRGGLKELTMALPHGQTEGFAEAVATDEHEDESENEADRRVQAILDWKKNYENGALYSELQDYLSESQQDEIHDCIRMSLTAWQRQFNPKNIAFVFDALCNAGGRLATLIEIAKRNKGEREPGAQAQTEKPTLKAEDQLLIEAINPPHDHLDQRLQTHATPVPVDEIKPKRRPGLILTPPPVNSGLTMSRSTAESSIGDVPQSEEAAVTPERFKDPAPEPIKTFAHEPSEGLAPESVESVLLTNLELFPIEPNESLSRVQAQTSEHILDAATRSSQVGARKIHGFEPQVRTDDVKSPADLIDDPSPAPYAFGILAKRGFQIGALVFLAIGFTIGFTVGLNTPPIPPETEESRPESQSAQSTNARPDDSASRVTPAGPASSAKGRSDLSSYLDRSSSVTKLDAPLPFGRQATSASDSVSLAKVPSTDSNSSPATEFKPSVNAEVNTEPNGSSGGRIARNAPLLPDREPAQSPNALEQVRGEPTHPALRSVALATLRPSRPSTILVRAPAEGSKSLTLTFPEKPVAVSSSFAITSQLSVLVSSEPGPAVAHEPAPLQAGELVSYVSPRNPKLSDRHRSSETIKVRATIGRDGEVLDVKRLSGSISLLPNAVGAIRRWRYKPTLLNNRPVKAQVDVTIEFWPPQH